MNGRTGRIAAGLAVAVVALASAVAPAQAAQPGSLKVMAFNVYQLPWIADPHPADKEARAQAAEATIRAENPDVLVLNEAFSAQAEQLRTRLAGTWSQQTPLVGQHCDTAPGWDSVNGDCSNSPIVVNGGVTILSKAPITARHQLVFGNSYQGTADYLSNKGAALARVDVGGRGVWVVGTHMQADEGPDTQAKAHEVRMAQLGEIRQLVAERATPDEPVVIGGDLNVEYWAGQGRPDDIGRTQHQQAQDALGAELLTAPDGDYTFDAETNPLAAESGAGYRDSLDYLGGLRGDGRPAVRTGPVTMPGFGNDTIPSDHYPVITHIEYQ